jgi:cytidyltransferase-like protein
MDQREQGIRIVQCHGVFDLLHPGHIRHFAAARSMGDVLVVTITADDFVGKGPGRPAFPQGLRSESLAALSVVDFVAVVDDA